MRAGTQLQADDDERTEVFHYSNIEDAPDTERELTPLGQDDDDDGVEMTVPFRRRAVAPISFVKPKRVIVIGPSFDAPPAPTVPAPTVAAPTVAAPTVPAPILAPAPPVSHGPRTLRMNAVPVAPYEMPRTARMHALPVPAMPIHAMAVPAMPMHTIAIASPVAAPAKRSARWPLFAAAVFLIGVTGVGFFFARNARLFERAARASAPTASAQVPVVAATASAAPSLATVDPPAIATLSASAPPAPTASIARRPVARAPAWPRPTAVAPVAIAPVATALPPASAEPLDIAALPATGKLTVICVPGCDQVFDSGRPLGASPVFKIVMSTGVHHLTLVTTDPPMKKQIDVNVVEDETAVVRADMK